MSTSWKEVNEKLTRHAAKNNIPLIGNFELTPRCNLNCKMCYLSRHANDNEAQTHELSAEKWIRIADNARDAGMLYLHLTGGEVFIRQDFRKIYEAVSKMGFFIQITTNATLITSETAKWLGDNPPSKVSVTLYGASPETYGKVCGHESGYEKAIDGIHMLLDEGITLELRTTVIRENAGEFDKLARFAESIDLDFGVVDYISPRREGTGTIPEEVRLSPEELSAYMSNADKHFKKVYKKVAGALKLEEKLTNNNAIINTGTPFKCGAGKYSFWLSWNGMMLICGEADTPSVPVSDMSFKECWKELQKRFALIPNCEDCLNCNLRNYCMTCPARLKNETGYFDKKADYLCKLAELDKESSMRR